MIAEPSGENTAIPPAVYTVASDRACTSKQFFTIQAPHIRVTDSVSPGTLSVNIRLVSNEPTSLAPGAWRAFISLDGRPTILSLEAGETVSVAYQQVTAGMHSIRYGVYRYDQIVQSQYFCRDVPPNARGKRPM